MIQVRHYCFTGLGKSPEKMDGLRDVFEYPDCVFTPPVISERVKLYDFKDRTGPPVASLD